MTQQKVTRPDDVIEIIKESLAQAKEIRIPSAPPIWDTANWEDSLRKCEALRKDLEIIRIRVKNAIVKHYGESSAFENEANSFFVSNSTLNDLKEERKRFVALLVRIVDELRLSALLESKSIIETPTSLEQSDLFKQQFPAGLPFGKKKPSFALIPEHGSQRPSFEDDVEIGVIRSDVYPNLTCLSLYDHLRDTPVIGKGRFINFIEALISMNQTPLEEKFFKVYSRQLNMLTSKDVPVLVPQAWIQWHSKNKRDLRTQASAYANDLLRVDFVAFWNNKRFAILIDDIGHYGKPNGKVWEADEVSYSNRLKEDRKLRKEGWEVFRISNWELRNDDLIPDILNDLQELIKF